MKVIKLNQKVLLGIIILQMCILGTVYKSLFRTKNGRKMLKDLKEETRESISSSSSLATGTIISRSDSSLPVRGKRQRDEIFILFWTKYFNQDPILTACIKGQSERYPECFKNCRITTNRSLIDVSDAVIFHEGDLYQTEPPGYRSYDQVWIFFQLESPSETYTNLTKYANFFNWTMTYRRDSDLWFPYGSIVKRRRSLSSSQNWMSKFGLKERKKMIIWIVSHCQTRGKREVIVDRLQQLVPVDIYGKCGIDNCTRGCLTVIAHQYKFYLAFENSVCLDYITEKFFNALRNNLVPIVYGGADYAAFAPPNSFIDARIFKSLKALVDYLKYLDGNDEKYLEYFKWKAHYKIKENDAWCRLCEKVKNHKKEPQQKIYGNLLKWWNSAIDSRIVRVKNMPSFIDASNNVDTTSAKNYTGSGQSFLESNNTTAACVSDNEAVSDFDTFEHTF